MIIDSSALVAILREESDAEEFTTCVAQAESVNVSAGTWLETSMVVGPSRFGDLDGYVVTNAIKVVAFDNTQARLAREAFARYGKGSGSRAKLNFGDCMAYALAKATNEPLLFKGDDFRHTDVVAAL